MEMSRKTWSLRLFSNGEVYAVAGHAGEGQKGFVLGRGVDYDRLASLECFVVVVVVVVLVERMQREREAGETVGGLISRRVFGRRDARRLRFLGFGRLRIGCDAMVV